MSEKKPCFLEPDDSAACISRNLSVAARVLRDLSQTERAALVDFYSGNEDEAAVCARYGHSAVSFRALRCRTREQFTAAALEIAAPKPSAATGSGRRSSGGKSA